MSAETFYITLMMEVEMVSETLGFIIHLKSMSVGEDFFESTWCSMEHLP